MMLIDQDFFSPLKVHSFICNYTFYLLRLIEGTVSVLFTAVFLEPGIPILSNCLLNGWMDRMICCNLTTRRLAQILVPTLLLICYLINKTPFFWGSEFSAIKWKKLMICCFFFVLFLNKHPLGIGNCVNHIPKVINTSSSVIQARPSFLCMFPLCFEPCFCSPPRHHL